MSDPTFLTYPMRPTSLGQLPKIGKLPWEVRWEPKANGKRVLVHRLSKTCWNRHGQLLSDTKNYEKALEELSNLFPLGEEWDYVDCEFMGSRLPIMKGSIFVLDLPCHPLCWRDRKDEILDKIELTEIAQHPSMTPPDQAVLCLPDYNDNCRESAWDFLQLHNKIIGCELWEGFVGKRNSHYQIQLRSDTEETKDWVKSRWRF